jgi:hypothetical protein
VILGGFSSDRELFGDLYILFDTINDINPKYIANKNKILLQVDPFANNNNNNFGFNCEVYHWKYDTEVSGEKKLSFNKVEHKLVNQYVSSSILHTNLNEKNDILLNIDNVNLSDDQTFNDIIEIIHNSVDRRLGEVKGHHDQRGLNIEYMKRQLLLLEKFLGVIDRYLETEGNHNGELLHKVDMIISNLTNSFDSDEIIRLVNNDFKDNQVINSLTNLLGIQVKLAERLNKLNI